MTKDRLTDLYVGQSDDEDIDQDYVVVNLKREVFIQAEEMRDMIDLVEKNVNEVKQKYCEILTKPNLDEHTKQELDDKMAIIKKYANRIFDKLKCNEQEIKEEEQTNKCGIDQRIRKTQHFTQSRRFVKIMTEYNQAQVDYRESCKQRLQRQTVISGRTSTNIELEDMLEQGNLNIFTQGIFMNMQNANQTLNDINARHATITKLETSIKELHDLFLNMGVLVESQGAVIDRIENHVGQAKEYVEDAKKDIEQAMVYQQKTRRKKILMIIIFVAVFGSVCIIF